MKEYRVKITEVHSDHVWVKANSKAEAEEMAISTDYLPLFEFLQDAVAMEEKDIEA